MICPECLESVSKMSECDAFEQCVECHDASECCPSEPSFEPCDVLTDDELVSSYSATLVERVISILDASQGGAQ